MVGAGAQIFMMFYFTLNAFVFFFSSESMRPPLYTIIMCVLAFMGIINGLVTMRLLKFFGLSDFLYAAGISSIALPFFIYTCMSMETILNAKSGGYSSRSLWRQLAGSVLWALVNGLCCFLGSYKGYMMKRIEPQARIQPVTRTVPEQPPLMSWPFIGIVFGGIQYLAMCVEFSSIMQSMWRAKIYALFWFLLTDVLLLIIVISLLSVIQTYLTL
mmetsp:Transcript_41906/g.55235  ORF Transcript_41906/g.55235 Transcript_41906/m.55235 type:complete len:215 (-) Transcript_41906:289-933(-)